jgi:beta-lactamase class D
MPTVVRLIASAFVAASFVGCSSSPRDASALPIETDARFVAVASRAFKHHADACLVIMDPETSRIRVMNPDRAAQRFPPASSFKVPNALIGLDTGVIPDADHVIEWDGTRHEREINNQSHSLRSAMRYSVLWYYQELARRVGEPRMRAAVESLNYGNADTSSGLTTFWLRGSIRISANEQAAFLNRLREGTNPVSPRAAAIVKDILILAEGPGWAYRGKTGTYSGMVDGVESDLGWFVGWVERDGNALVFAANDGTKGVSGPDVRASVEQALVELGQLPLDWERHQREVPLPF